VQQIAQALGETQLVALGQIKGRMRTIGSGNPPVRTIPIACQGDPFCYRLDSSARHMMGYRLPKDPLTFKYA
jgi:hypothetical protein